MTYAHLDKLVKVPAPIRAQIKSLIQSAPGFGDFERGLNKATRNYTKEEWFAAADACGVARQVLDIINNYLANPAPVTPGGASSNAYVIDDAAFEGDDDDDETEKTPAPASIYEASKVLEGVRNLLAPAIVLGLEARLAPVIAAANKPAVIQTVYRDVATTPAGEAVPYARRQGEISLDKAFGVGAARGASKRLTMSIWDAADAPPVDHMFVPDYRVIAPLVSSIERNENVWLFGPAGTGKTTLPMQIAAVARRPFVRISFTRAVEPIDLIGCEGLDGKGGMTWRDGALTKAIRRPGTIILLDEPTFAPPGTLAILQTLLDHRFITLTDGSVVRCAEGVSFVAADNTAGSGDASGVYAGTQAMNAALSDRFARHISIDYMPAAQETRALINHTGAPKEAAARVVQFLNNVRTAYARDGGARPVSLRQAVAFIRAAQDGFRPADAAEMVFYNRLPDADRETVRQLFRTQFDDNAFALEMDGRVITPQSQAPEQIKAREVFEETDVL